MAKTLLGAAVVIGLCFLALTAATTGQAFLFVFLAVVVAIGFGLVKD